MSFNPSSTIPLPTTGSLSAGQVLHLWPGLEEDLVDVGRWMDGKFDMVASRQPLARFRQVAQDMLDTYDKFPDDAHRMRRILRLLSQGHQPRPIFVDGKDGFLMEGRHRIVAFMLAGIEEIDVLTVSRT